MPRADYIQVRRGLAAEWTATNPVLGEGEFGLETDTLKLKIGNGTDEWVTLPYVAGSGVVDATYVTSEDETAVLPESRQLIAGSNITLDDTTPGQLEISSSNPGGTVTVTGSPVAGELTQFSGASSITNGNLSGDVTTSNTLAATIANDAVTFAKMQDIATDRLIGRDTAGTGNPEEISLGASLEFSGSQSIQRAALTGDVTASANSNATTIPNDTVTFAKMQNVAANSVPARAASSSGDLSEVSLSASNLLGRGSTGDIAAISLGSGVSMSGTTLSATGTGGTVTTTGSPASGNLTKFSGASSITNGDLSGDVTTSGSLVVTIASNQKTATITFIIDGGGAVITTGIKGDLEIPFGCTIEAWTLLADQSGAVKIDIWKDVYANYPPDNSDSITNGHEPEIAASGTNAQDTSLGDWTTVTVTAGDTIRFNVDSCTSIKRVTLSLKVTKT